MQQHACVQYLFTSPISSQQQRCCIVQNVTFPTVPQDDYCTKRGEVFHQNLICWYYNTVLCMWRNVIFFLWSKVLSLVSHSLRQGCCSTGENRNVYFQKQLYRARTIKIEFQNSRENIQENFEISSSALHHITSGLNLCLEGASKMFLNSYKSFQTKMASAARLCFRPLLAR